jgi:hypothetical protein
MRTVLITTIPVSWSISWQIGLSAPPSPPGLKSPEKRKSNGVCNALLSQHQGFVCMTAFITINRPLENDDELLVATRIEQGRSGRRGAAIPLDELTSELNEHLAMGKRDNDGMKYFLERRTTIKDACRLDSATYNTPMLPKELSGTQTLQSLQESRVVSLNNFASATLVAKSKGEF